MSNSRKLNHLFNFSIRQACRPSRRRIDFHTSEISACVDIKMTFIWTMSVEQRWNISSIKNTAEFPNHLCLFPAGDSSETGRNLPLKMGADEARHGQPERIHITGVCDSTTHACTVDCPLP